LVLSKYGRESDCNENQRKEAPMDKMMVKGAQESEHRRRSKRLGIKPGPKPKADRMKRSVTLFFSVREDQAARIREQAEKSNLSVSSFLSKTVLDCIGKKTK